MLDPHSRHARFSTITTVVHIVITKLNFWLSTFLQNQLSLVYYIAPKFFSIFFTTVNSCRLMLYSSAWKHGTCSKAHSMCHWHFLLSTSKLKLKPTAQANCKPVSLPRNNVTTHVFLTCFPASLFWYILPPMNLEIPKVAPPFHFCW